MRRTLILMLTAGVVGMGLGCCRTLQHTAGVCDCNPPPVNSVVTPYEGIAPAAAHEPPTIVAVPAPMPQGPVPEPIPAPKN